MRAKAMACFAEVIAELAPESALLLRDERVQVEVINDENAFSVWAYFPMHAKRAIAAKVPLRRQTRVLLLLSKPIIEKQPSSQTKAELRDHIGHTLLYLRNPKAQNDCTAAGREWARSARGTR